MRLFYAMAVFLLTATPFAYAQDDNLDEVVDAADEAMEASEAGVENTVNDALLVDPLDALYREGFRVTHTPPPRIKVDGDTSKPAKIAGEHCMLLLRAASRVQGVGPNMTFVIGATAGGWSREELIGFNQAFAHFVVETFRISGDYADSGQCHVELAQSTQKEIADFSRPGLEHRGHSQNTVVNATVVSKQTQVPLVMSYYLYEGRAGDWYISDMSINGKPVNSNYRSKLTQIYRKSGYDALIQALSNGNL